MGRRQRKDMIRCLRCNDGRDDTYLKITVASPLPEESSEAWFAPIITTLFVPALPTPNKRCRYKLRTVNPEKDMLEWPLMKDFLPVNVFVSISGSHCMVS